MEEGKGRGRHLRLLRKDVLGCGCAPKCRNSCSEFCDNHVTHLCYRCVLVWLFVAFFCLVFVLVIFLLKLGDLLYSLIIIIFFYLFFAVFNLFVAFVSLFICIFNVILYQ